ncbi:MAG TPA: hypothetical protein VL688_01530 [Verrucomicrobiae bacterium]|nr:hypothetical protein [Verrucomicrobiae bacterium]
MKLFKFKARDANGFECGGTLKAVDEDEARKLLEAQGREPLWLEEDHEAAGKLNPRTLEALGARRPQKGLLWEILGYAMPVGAMLIAVSGILIVSKNVRPPSVKVGPEKVIEEYLGHEHTGAYEKQFELFSPKTKEFYGTPTEYVRKKKQTHVTSDGSPFQFGKSGGLTEVKHARFEAQYEAKVLRMQGVARVDFFLVLSKHQWRIDAVRDPAAVEYYLGLLDQEKDEEAQRKTLIALKTQTHYSDLEIENLLHDYRKEKKKKELGGEYAFAL